MMEKVLQELHEKIEEIKKTQEAILSRLNDCIILPKLTPRPSTSDKKAEEEARKEEMLAVIMHGARVLGIISTWQLRDKHIES